MSMQQDQAKALHSAVCERIDDLLALLTESRECGFTDAANALHDSIDRLLSVTDHLAKSL